MYNNVFWTGHTAVSKQNKFGFVEVESEFMGPKEIHHFFEFWIDFFQEFIQVRLAQKMLTKKI